MTSIYWHETGPLVTYDGKLLHIHDLNPELYTRWTMTRWELFVFGLRTLVAAITAGAVRVK